MNLRKTERVVLSMIEHNIKQIVISDVHSIHYLTGQLFSPGERLIALCLFANGNHKLIVNRLFPVNSDISCELIWYDDIDDSAKILADQLDKSEICGIDKNLPSYFLLRLQEMSAAVGYINSSPIVDGVRRIKDEDEQDKMRLSSVLNDQVMEQLITFANKGLPEESLAAQCLELYKQIGCEGVSFPPITSYGKNAADPHHEADETLPKYGDCVVLDIGGMKNNYASDMTRTVFLGEASPRAKEIYNVVLEANLRGIAAAKPGNRMCDVDNAARDYIVEKGFGQYFTHRTGHSIGMEDHENGDVSSVNTAKIEVGQCFSVEPGIYIPEEGIGVRIEDLVLITPTGCEVLNRFPKELTILPFEK